MSIVKELKKKIKESGGDFGTPQTIDQALKKVSFSGGAENTGLPAVTSSDNGSGLSVQSGEWAVDPYPGWDVVIVRGVSNDREGFLKGSYNDILKYLRNDTLENPKILYFYRYMYGDYGWTYTCEMNAYKTGSNTNWIKLCGAYVNDDGDGLSYVNLYVKSDGTIRDTQPA